MTRHLSILAILMTGTAADAVEPVGGEAFNTDPGFDLAALTAENFHDTIVPLAEEEGTLTFFDFTNSFGPLFQEHLIPMFEDQYAITVEYVRGDGNTAVQQLLAALNAGRAAPADVYFVGSGSSLATLMGADAMANVPLHELLPNAAGFDPQLATNAAGHDHGGVYTPFHRNQTSIAYNSAMLDGATPPTTLEGLLDYATENPGTVAVTNPTRGGSGNGFLQSVAHGLVEGAECRAAFTDYAMTTDEAEAYVAGPCMAPVWDYYNRLLPVVELTNGNSDTLNLIANGAASVGTAWEDMAYDFMGRGLLPPATRQMLLETGQVGGGDGMFWPVGAENPAAGLLFLDYMASHEVQLTKLRVNGSRSARTDIDPTAEFTEGQAARLIPTDQYAERTFQQMPQPLKSAMGDHFTAQILRN